MSNERIDHAAEARRLALRGDALVRFEAKVNRSGTCWLWLAARDAHGYGRFGIAGATRREWRMFLAHRVSYETYIGPIPEGLDLDHLCRNRACVNPEHLEPVTRSVNLSRSPLMARGKDKTHCPQGHEYTAENTRLDTNGARNCRECARSRNRTKTRAGIYNPHVSCKECGKGLRERNLMKHMNVFHPDIAASLGLEAPND